MRAQALTVGLLLATARLTAQPGTITTIMGAYPLDDGTVKVIAGTGKAVNTGDGGPATEADVNAPIALALGPGDALYISTQGGIRKIRPDGIISGAPLPSRLGETTVLLAGKPLGLRGAAEGEVKGLIPFSVADATIQQMIGQRGSSYSLPEPVLIAPVQPAVCTVEGTGRGAGEIYINVDDVLVPVDAARPAIAGEEVRILT